VEICIPPLRERTEEILPVARRFLDLFNKQYGRSRELTPEIERCLLAYRWPGNVRELENIVRRMVVLSDIAPVLDALGTRREAPSSAPAPPTPTGAASPQEALRDIARHGARQAEGQGACRGSRTGELEPSRGRPRAEGQLQDAAHKITSAR